MCSLSDAEGLSLFVLYYSAWTILLSRFLGQEHILQGVFRPNFLDLQKDVIPSATHVDSTSSFLSLAQSIDTSLKEESYISVDIPTIQMFLNNLEESLYHPIYQIQFSFIQGNVPPNPHTISHIPVDLNLKISQQKDQLTFQMIYRSDVYASSSIKRLIQAYIRICSSCVTYPHSTSYQLAILSESEKQKILYTWNKTQSPYPIDKTIHQLFEEQANRTPHHVAVIYEGQELTYLQLNQRSNQLAHYLREQGVSTNDLVAICCDRSLEMIVGILGILKAGGAYVPIDSNYPTERVGYMFQEANANYLLTYPELHSIFTLDKKKTVDLGQIAKITSSYSSENPPPITTQENLAYIIFTSGSTGKPKGTELKHKGIVNSTIWYIHQFELNEKDHCLQFYSMSFDPFLGEIFPILCTGGCLHMPSDKIRMDPHLLMDFINQNRITIADLPTSLAKGLLSCWPPNGTLRIMKIGGDALNWSVPNELSFDIWNMYGPTETTMDATAYHTYAARTPARPTTFSFIGRPIANVQVYILDAHLQPVPIGVVGELYIGGEGVAQGYLNRPELTKERFIENPFLPGSHFYKTGDLCRHHQDGNIEYIGRSDQQVKIRGFRIELGEIEVKLMAHESIKEAIVLAREDKNGHKGLIAYYVSRKILDLSELQTYLKYLLPDYMIPSLFVKIDEMPYTLNGKIDRKFLLALENDNGIEKYIAPRTPIEQILAEIWQEILQVKIVGVRDNFFQLGGDSILSIQMIAKAREKGVHLKAHDIFQTPILADLAAVLYIDERASVNIFKDRKGEVSLLPIQLQFFNLKDLNLNTRGQTRQTLLPEDIHIEAFEQAIYTVITHHDIFRMRYRHQVQWYDDSPPPVVIEHLSLSPEEIEAHIENLHHSLNIEEGPLYRISLLKRHEEERVMVIFVIHRLIIDRISWHILFQDISKAYESSIKDKKTKVITERNPYKDWAMFLEDIANTPSSPICLLARHYWLGQSISPPLYVDYEEKLAYKRPHKVERVSWSLNRQQTTILMNDLSRNHLLSIRDILLATLMISYGRWSRQNEAIIHVESSGRHEDLADNTLNIQNTIGWFTSLYPIHLTLNNHFDILEILKDIKDQIMHVPHHGIGYGILRHLADQEGHDQLKIYDQPHITFTHIEHLEEKQDLFVPLNSIFPEDMRDLPTTENLFLDCFTSVQKGCLTITLALNLKYYNPSQLHNIKRIYEQTINDIITSCSEFPKTQWLVPSDFPLLSLTQEQIDQIIPEDATKAYPLSSMQRDIFKHVQNNPNSGKHIIQSFYLLEGEFHPELFKKAWDYLVAHHDILRTSFMEITSQGPLQIVHKFRAIPWIELDWREKHTWTHNGFDSSEIPLMRFFRIDLTQHREYFMQAVHEVLELERHRGFSLSDPTLMRFYLIRLTSFQTLFVLVNHQIILDGWSAANLLVDLLRAYHTLHQGERLKIPHPIQFDQYIAWVQQQSNEAAIAYWHDILKDLPSPTTLSIKKEACSSLSQKHHRLYEDLLLDETLSMNLKSWSKKNTLTLNTLFLGAWGLILKLYSNQDGIVTGMMVSGRSSGFAHSQQQIGLLTNILPIVIHFGDTISTLDYLHHLQNQQSDSSQYDYLSLTEIQSLTPFKTNSPLINHLFLFENYPLGEPFSAEDKVQIVDFFLQEKINYDLNIMILPGKEITVRLEYNPDCYHRDDMKEMLINIKDLLVSFLRH